MNASLSRSRRKAGYTLVEVLAASGLLAAAIGAAASLSMSMTQQEEMARGQAVAIRYGEAVARLWQLGVEPSTVLLNQPVGLENSNSADAMTYSIAASTAISLGSDGGIPQGTVQKSTVTVSYVPYGKASTDRVSINFDVLRPADAHR